MAESIGDALQEGLEKIKRRASQIEHMQNKRCALETAGRIFNVNLLVERGATPEESAEVLGAVTNLAAQLTDWLEDDSE